MEEEEKDILFAEELIDQQNHKRIINEDDSEFSAEWIDEKRMIDFQTNLI